jgi:hypothetical protein
MTQSAVKTGYLPANKRINPSAGDEYWRMGSANARARRALCAALDDQRWSCE